MKLPNNNHICIIYFLILKGVSLELNNGKKSNALLIYVYLNTCVIQLYK